MFTILTRTSNRPNYFQTCRQSILEQTTGAYHIVSTDDAADTYPEGDLVLPVERQPGRCHNLYFNYMRYHVPNRAPWVVHIDDDDQFTTPDALATIQKHIQDENSLLLWKVDLGEYVVPTSWGNPPKPGDISGIGFCVHVKHWVPWQGIPYGDYHVISRYYQKLNPVWIPEILTRCQTGPGHGLAIDKK